jgi:DNA polymerase-3 subunit delta
VILLLHGEDTFRSRAKLRAIKEKFLATPGAESNLLDAQASELSVQGLSDALLAAPFLSRTRLVIIRGLLSEKSPKLAEPLLGLLDRIPPTTVLVLYDASPDKRLKLFKELKKAAKLEEFAPLDEGRLAAWVRNYAEERGGQISALAAQSLITACGPSLWRLSSELDKLIAYAPEITKETIDLLVRSESNPGVFDFADAIGSGNRRKALQLLQNFTRNGESEIYLLTMIARHFRQMILIKSLGRGVGARQTGELKIHPFVARKLGTQAERFSQAQLSGIYSRLAETDLALKTGAAEPKEALQDLVIALTVGAKAS